MWGGTWKKPTQTWKHCTDRKQSSGSNQELWSCKAKDLLYLLYVD